MTQTLSLDLDGELVGSSNGLPYDYYANFVQVGTGYTAGYPNALDGWFGFGGQIDEVRIWTVARTAEELQTPAPSA